MDGSVSSQILFSYLSGSLTFLSTCLIPVLLAYLAFVTAGALLELDQQREARIRWASLVFGVGFSMVFALGIIRSTSQLLMVDSFQTLAKIAGAVSMAFGLSFISRAGMTLPRQSGADARPSGMPFGLPGAFIVGALFGAVWPHCLGPILERLLELSFSPISAGRGSFLLIVYAVGFASSFGLSGLVLQRLLPYALTRLSEDKRRTILTISGIIMLMIGISLIFTKLWLSLNRVFIGLAGDSPTWRLEDFLLQLLR